jgi:hypothetical protein
MVKGTWNPRGRPPGGAGEPEAVHSGAARPVPAFSLRCAPGEGRPTATRVPPHRGNGPFPRHPPPRRTAALRSCLLTADGSTHDYLGGQPSAPPLAPGAWTLAPGVPPAVGRPWPARRAPDNAGRRPAGPRGHRHGAGPHGNRGATRKPWGHRQAVPTGAARPVPAFALRAAKGEGRPTALRLAPHRRPAHSHGNPRLEPSRFSRRPFRLSQRPAGPRRHRQAVPTGAARPVPAFALRAAKGEGRPTALRLPPQRGTGPFPRNTAPRRTAPLRGCLLKADSSTHDDRGGKPSAPLLAANP